MELVNGLRNPYFKLDTPARTKRRIVDRLEQAGIPVEWTARYKVADDLFWCGLTSSAIDLSSNGKGLSAQFAEASACAEFVERLSFPMQWAKNIHGDFYLPHMHDFTRYKWLKGFEQRHQDEVTGPFLSIEEILSRQRVHADTRTARHFARNEITHIWADGYSLMQNRHVKVPVKFVEWVSSSNGLAAGNTMEEALLQATFELFERHTVLEILGSERHVPTIDPDTLEDERIQRIIRIMDSHRMQLMFKDFSLDGLFPCTGLVVRNQAVARDNMEHHLIFEGASFSSIERAIRCLTESVQGRFVDQKRRSIEPRSMFNKKILDHVSNHTPLFGYGVPQRDVSFLEKGDVIQARISTKDDLFAEIGSIKEICKKIDSDWIVVDMTHPVIGFPVVRVIMPGLLNRLSCITDREVHRRKAIVSGFFSKATEGTATVSEGLPKNIETEGLHLTSECHVLEDQGDHYAYFPLKLLLLKINASGRKCLEKLKSGETGVFDGDALEFCNHLHGLGVLNGSPDSIPSHRCSQMPKPVKTILMISDKCPLKCVYCYGDAQPTGALMEEAVAGATIDELLKNARDLKSGFISVNFNGGGEPTANWQVLRHAVDYARTHCRREGLFLQTTLVTNGIISESQADWLAENIQSITVSIDGPEKIHNRQRPFANGDGSFAHVARTLERLKQRKKAFKLRMTVTADACSEFPENYSYLVDTFQPVMISAEPVFCSGRCRSTGCRQPSAEAFIRSFKTAYLLAEERGVPLTFSGARLDRLETSFCSAAGRAFCVTPRGEVTACIEVGTGKDPRADLFHFGSYEPESGFIFDKERHERLCSLHVENLTECRNCFARWHCSGDCPAKRPDMAEFSNRNLYRCELNRELIKFHLLNHLDAV